MERAAAQRRGQETAPVRPPPLARAPALTDAMPLLVMEHTYMTNCPAVSTAAPCVSVPVNEKLPSRATRSVVSGVGGLLLSYVNP